MDDSLMITIKRQLNIELTYLQICDGPYLGTDQLLGLCKCEVDDLEEICDLQCRLAQRYSLSFICPPSPLEPFIEVRDGNGQPKVSQTLALQVVFPFRN